MRILAVDDEPTSRLIVETVLRELGHETHIVTDGTEAWAAVESYRPDVIISDWLMPGLTGIELCRKVRARTTGRHTYFILVTSQGRRDQVVQGMNAGADDYLVKPLDPDALELRLIAASRVTALHHQLAEQRVRLEGLNNELALTARRDGLTDVGNRRALDEDLDRLEARMLRYGQSYCVALLDVDHFKAYNDMYGHHAGDLALQAVAAELGHQARRGDAVYRYGGEEFVCILPEQSLANATIGLQRMRAGLERRGIAHARSPGGVLTLSAGLAMLDPGHCLSVAEVLKQADAALYRAKRQGRNRVEHGLPAVVA